MESVRSQSNGPVLHRSLSPTRHYRSFSYSSSSSSSFSSSTYSASSASAFGFNGFPARSLSPTRPVNLRSLSPGRNMKPSSSMNKHNNVNAVLPRFPQKRTCMCSPTNHPGSFRCSLHRNSSAAAVNNSGSHSRGGGLTEARRSAMRNSLVRICAVEGDGMLKRALSSLIRPSSHQLRRRSDFRPAVSRLSRMTRAEDSRP